MATFKSELVGGQRFPSFEHGEHETLAWTSLYNHERLHEELGDVPPAEYERNHVHEHRAPRRSTGQPALTRGALTGLDSQATRSSGARSVIFRCPPASQSVLRERPAIAVGRG